MALEDELQQDVPQENPEEIDVEDLTDSEEEDLDIMVNLAKTMIDEGGYSVVEQAEASSDPAQIIGQFLLQLGSQIAEQLPADAKPSPRIMLCEGGWVEQVSDYLQEEYDVSRDTMDRAEMYVGSGAQAIAQGQQQPGGPAGPAPAPEAPVGGPV